MKWFILDVWHPGDYFREKEMIESQEPLVRCNLIAFANLAWDNGTRYSSDKAEIMIAIINIKNSQIKNSVQITTLSS